MTDADRIVEIARIFEPLYPPTPELEFSSAFSLLVAAVLAAQCTDERVNMVTATLFDTYPGPKEFAEADLEEIEEAIHSTGFYRQKAKTLKNCSAAIVDVFGGRVPGTVAEMVKLPGVGRKTANLVLGNAVGVPGVFVDTHVKRLSTRMGFTSQTNPEKIEAVLSKLLPEELQVAFSNRMTHHGRSVCKARKPACGDCPIAELCPKVGV